MTTAKKPWCLGVCPLRFGLDTLSVTVISAALWIEVACPYPTHIFNLMERVVCASAATRLVVANSPVSPLDRRRRARRKPLIYRIGCCQLSRRSLGSETRIEAVPTNVAPNSPSKTGSQFVAGVTMHKYYQDKRFS